MQQFDPNSAAHDLFNRYDEELIKISGSPIFYYEALIQLQTVDKMYMEDRGKLFSPNYKQTYAIYEPPDQQNMSTMFQIDSPEEEIILELNYRAFLRDVGLPKLGSRVYTPHRGENWIVLDYRLGQFKLWGTLRLQLHCKHFQETTTTGEGNVSQARPDFQIIG